jgi:hypothetical protein
MALQEIFDKSIAQMRKNGKQIKIDGKCVYYCSETNEVCGIGCLLSKIELNVIIRKELNHASVIELYNAGILPQKLIGEQTLKLLQHLQVLNDRYLKENLISKFEQGVEALAKDFNLIYKAP